MFSTNATKDRIKKQISNEIDIIKKDNITENMINSLTYQNGIETNVFAVFVDIVSSSSLTEFHRNKTLAKIYRCYISELLRIFRNFDSCIYQNINGDCVYGIFDANEKENIKDVVTSIIMIEFVIILLNNEIKHYNINIDVGIGVDYGKTLIIKAGEKGTNVYDYLYMGDVINNTCHLCNKANRYDYKKIIFGHNIIDILITNEITLAIVINYYNKFCKSIKCFTNNFENNLIMQFDSLLLAIYEE